MTFPTYKSTTETITRATGTAFTANMPASGINSGDYIILIIDRQITQSQSYTQASGPTMSSAGISGSWGASTNCGFTQVWVRVADGTENGATQNWNSSFNSVGFCVAKCTVIVVSGQATSSPISGSSVTSITSTTNPNPPSLTPPGGALDYLWITYAASSTNSSISSYPTNYSTGHSSNAISGGSCASAIRTLNASSEDPGTFTFSVSGNTGALTLAIAPLATPSGGPRAIIIA